MDNINFIYVHIWNGPFSYMKWPFSYMKMATFIYEMAIFIYENVHFHIWSSMLSYTLSYIKHISNIYDKCHEKYMLNIYETYIIFAYGWWCICDSVLVYFVFHNYGFVSFPVQDCISLKHRLGFISHPQLRQVRLCSSFACCDFIIILVQLHFSLIKTLSLASMNA